MFEFVAAAEGASGGSAVAGWAQVENAACARRLAAIAEMLETRLSADGSAEREQWCIDNWDAVSAEVAAAQHVSLGVASHQLMVTRALRQRLPRLAEVFATGQISYRLVNAIVYRTALITDPEARAQVDAAIAAAVPEWGALSVAKLATAIDYWVDRYDPYALRRVEQCSRGRYLDIHDAGNGTGVSWLEGCLLSPDAAALDKRLEAMARAVCADDARTLEQRRADALGALAHGADRLTCGCDNPECDAAAPNSSAVVIHVIAEAASLTDDTEVAVDGAPAPARTPLREMTPAEALAPEPPTGPAHTAAAVMIGGTIVPAPLLVAKLAPGATIRPLIHPGDAPPEPRYRPSRALADFVRCRDMTCRFPGCDEPADGCDLDRTIASPVGPTRAANLACLCRKHHLLKTFWGWLSQQLPDGTLIWTAPGGDVESRQLCWQKVAGHAARTATRRGRRNDRGRSLGDGPRAIRNPKVI